MRSHNLFIVSVVIIIVIFILVILGILFSQGEKFTNPSGLSKNSVLSKPFYDTVVPDNLKYKNATPFYEDLDDGLKGTSLVNVSEVLSNRFPIAIETSTNWYSTQPLINAVGTDNGKLHESECMCNENRFSL